MGTTSNRARAAEQMRSGEMLVLKALDLASERPVDVGREHAEPPVLMHEVPEADRFCPGWRRAVPEALASRPPWESRANVDHHVARMLERLRLTTDLPMVIIRRNVAKLLCLVDPCHLEIFHHNVPDYAQYTESIRDLFRALGVHEGEEMSLNLHAVVRDALGFEEPPAPPWALVGSYAFNHGLASRGLNVKIVAVTKNTVTTERLFWETIICNEIPLGWFIASHEPADAKRERAGLPCAGCSKPLDSGSALDEQGMLCSLCLPPLTRKVGKLEFRINGEVVKIEVAQHTQVRTTRIAAGLSPLDATGADLDKIAETIGVYRDAHHENLAALRKFSEGVCAAIQAGFCNLRELARADIDTVLAHDHGPFTIARKVAVLAACEGDDLNPIQVMRLLAAFTIYEGQRVGSRDLFEVLRAAWGVDRGKEPRWLQLAQQAYERARKL